MSARPGRSFAVWTLVVLACVAGALALLVGYFRHAAVDSDQFANRATVALKSSAVRSLIAERVTDQLILRHQADLIAARPLIESVVSSAVGGRAFTGVFRAGVRDVHRAVFNRDQHTFTLAVSDIGSIAAAALELVQPTVADRLRTTNHVNVMQRDIGSITGRLAGTAETIRLLAWLLLLVAVACAAGAIALAPDRRRTVVRLGVGTAISGVVILIALAILRKVANDSVSGADAHDAVSAVWDAFLGDLETAAFIFAGAGAIVAAAAASLIRPIEIDVPVRRIAGWITREPTRPAFKVIRGVALIAAGLLLLFEHELVIQAAFAVAGVYLIFAGLSVLLRLVYRPREVTADERAAPAPARSHRRREWAMGAIASVLVVAAVVTFVGTGGTSTAAPVAGGCDGSRKLCDRSLENIALPATHNSMSVPLPGWFSSQQDRPIAQQLNDGIRGLLIDTHYADLLADGKLRTYVGNPAQLRRNAKFDGVSPTAIDAALRTRDRLGFAGKGKRGVYLCHSFCELGGTSLDSVLADLHDFLIANPGEVVVVINQDYIKPEDFVSAVQDAGLDKLAYRGPTGPGQWPTLRRMIDTNQRVVFLAENEAGGAPWYHLAYEHITQETPFHFTRPAQLTDPSNTAATCRPNRGPADAPIFLVNHWITTDPVPLPSQAAQVNAYGPLIHRLRECRRIRHHIPNLIAVNFYSRGDLFRAVNTLNGVNR
jgi:hypothetical protein